MEQKTMSISSQDSLQEIFKKLEKDSALEQEFQKALFLSAPRTQSQRTLNEKIYEDAYAFSPEHDPFRDCIAAQDVMDGKHINE